MAIRLANDDGSITLIEATEAALDAESAGAAAIAAHLGVAATPAWPPEHIDADTRDWWRGLLRGPARRAGFGTWHIVAAGELVGQCGFKGPPDASGEAEIGYSIVADRQRRGHAGAAVALLLRHA